MLHESEFEFETELEQEFEEEQPLAWNRLGEVEHREELEQALGCSAPTRITVSGFPRFSNSVAHLLPNEQAKIRNVAGLILRSFRPGCRPLSKVRLVGHADSDLQRERTEPGFMMRISGERALAVRRALERLLNNRALSSRIAWSIAGAGASQLAVPNASTEAARRRNRCVQILLAEQTAGPSTPGTQGSVLTTGQVVNVEIRESNGAVTAFSHEYPIDSAGNIRIPSGAAPAVGIVPARGRTLVQLRQAIFNALTQGRILLNPTVNVSLSSKTVTPTQRVGVGDTVHVRVLESGGAVDPSSGAYMVDSAGKLHLPVVGEIDAAGKTVADLESQIQRGITAAKFLVNSVVHVSMVPLNS
jgi:protein involved in polysaccharide export with SLBB domain